MIALIAANVVGIVLFSILYTVAGTGHLPQPAFLACLVVLLGLVTALWVRTEARHRHLEPVRRIGRVAFGLVAVAIGVPIVVLMPLFWLDTQLPHEAGLNAKLAPIMAVVLMSLALIAVVNVLGIVIAALRGALVRARG